jgi:prephenate dehydrogenase
VSFVGAHPLAGSEKQGPENADPDLFRDRVVVLTPTAATDPHALARVASFWESLGSRLHRMSPEGHDAALALTSHLPHLVASSLAAVLPPEMARLTATGFRDTTRIASGDPSLWSAIFDENRAEVLRALSAYEAALTEFRRALESGDREELKAMLSKGRLARAAVFQTP